MELNMTVSQGTQIDFIQSNIFFVFALGLIKLGHLRQLVMIRH